MERGIVCGGVNAGEDGVGLLARRASLGHRGLEALGHISLALVRRFLGAVDEDHVDIRLRRDHGDAAAHEPSAQHADAGVLALWHAGRPAHELVRLRLVHEQRAQHVAGYRVREQLRHVFSFQTQGCLDGQLRPFIHA